MVTFSAKRKSLAPGSETPLKRTAPRSFGEKRERRTKDEENKVWSVAPQKGQPMYWILLAAAAGGLVNGLFGGGGGMVLLPILTKKAEVDEHTAFATCLALMWPISAVSAVVYLFTVRPPLSLVLPAVGGGLLGGFLGARCFQKVPVGVLRTLFALFLLYAGGRYLFC